MMEHYAVMDYALKDYDARVEEERLMWQPLVDEEKRKKEDRERAEEAKRKRWRDAFPIVTEFAPPSEFVTVHKDGSRLYNQLLLMKQADREWVQEHRYKLSPPIVVAEILRFIDVSPDYKCSSTATTSTTVEEPLYTTLGQELRISKRYEPVRDAKGKKKHGFNIFATGMFYLDTRLQQDNIQVFIDETHRADATKSHWIPESVKALSAFAQRFLCDLKTEISKLKQEEIDSLPRLVSRTHDTRARVDLVYKLVEPFRGETRWTNEKVDKLWAYVFSFTIEPLVIAEYQAPLLHRLQSDLLSVFLLFADNLYSFGQCPAQFNEEFVFYELPEGETAAPQPAAVATDATVRLSTSSNSSENTRMRSSSMVKECRVAVRDARCRLWNSTEFLSSMLTGVQTRTRLGALDWLDRSFSRAFTEKLMENVGSSEGEMKEGEERKSPHSFVSIRAALLAATRKCTHTLTEEFMAAFRKQDRLSTALKDARSIFIGAAMCAYAGSLRGGAAVRTIEVREAFSRSLIEAKISPERRKRWGVDTEEKYGRIVAKLEWPLPYVLHPALLTLLGDARHFILNLLRCSEIIMDIQCDVEHPVAEDCRRPFLLLMRNLLQLITLISELFYKQAQVLVDRYFARIDGSTTVDEAREQADVLHDRMRDLMGSSGIRKMVRDIVDMFCKMTDEIHLFLLSGKITSMEVFKWSKVVERERSMLISMGENMTNNVLADLVTMLKIR